MLPTWLRACALVLASAVVPFGARPGDAADPNPIRALDVAFAQPVRESVATTFTASAAVVPNSGGSPWVVFVWDFGDGTVVDTGRVDGTAGEPVTDVRPHTYAVGGTYTVRCSAYHGYTDLGYRFSKTTLRQVDVVCADAAPSPKRCGAVAFSTFTGRWDVRDGFTENAPTYATLDLVEAVGRVRGTFDDGTTVWDAKGKVTVGTHVAADARLPVVRVKLKMKARPGPAAKDDATHATLELTAGYGTNGRHAYRSGPYKLTGGPRGILHGIALLSPTTPVPAATLCTQLKAGRARTEPGDFLAFVAAVQNEGEANLAGDRVVMTVEVEGATIVSETVKPTRMTQVGATSRTVTFGLSSLGEGKKGDGRAAAAFVVLVDPNADVVKCRLSAADLDPHDDARFASANLPPDRVLCIPVDRD